MVAGSKEDDFESKVGFEDFFFAKKDGITPRLRETEMLLASLAAGCLTVVAKSRECLSKSSLGPR